MGIFQRMYKGTVESVSKGKTERPNLNQAPTIEMKIRNPSVISNIAGIHDAPNSPANKAPPMLVAQNMTNRDRGGTLKSRAIAKRSKRF